MAELLAVLERGVKAHRIGLAMLGAALVVIGAIGLGALYSGMQMRGKALFGSYVLSPAGLLVLAYVSLKRWPALDLLRTSPERIVWWLIRDRGRHGVELCFGLDDGKRALLPLEPSDVAIVEGLLPRTLPHAPRRGEMAA